MPRPVLLWCGVCAAVLYALMNVVVPMQWDAYSSVTQSVSELSAIGAPTRALWVWLGVLYTLLVAAFGWGVLRSAAGRPTLRVAGAALIVHGLIGLAWPPMHQRDVLAAGGATLTDTLHIVWTVATIALMLVVIGSSAMALGTHFRRYSLATVVILMLFGWLAGLDAPRMEANLPTPWMGVTERVSVAAFLVWVIVFAATLMRLEPRARVPSP